MIWNKKNLMFLGMTFSFTLLLSFPGPRAQETAVAVPPEKDDAVFPEMTADLKTITFDQDGHQVSNVVKIFRNGLQVRHENREADPIVIWISDYSKMLEYRIHEKDKVFFERTFKKAALFRAARRGMIPFPEESTVEMNRIFLKKDEVNGYPVELFLIVRKIKDREDLGSEYSLFWEATELDRQPLRVAFYVQNLALNILEFENLELKPVDKGLFSPPKDYMGLSPF